MKKLVVVGLGPVGLTLAVAAGINHPAAGIMGLDQNQTLVDLINRNQSQLQTNDNDFHTLLSVAISEKKFQATSNPECLAHAEVVVLAVGPAVLNDKIESASFLMAVDEIAQRALPKTLVIIASTLPVGMMQMILPRLNHLKVAYAFERITPGGNMLNSASERKKIIAAKDVESYEAARIFFKVNESVLVSFEEAEMTKLLENSYRATNIALIQEWTLLAESMGVNLFSVVDSIRLRTGTHDNIRSPGAGIGGPCLLKDSMLSILNSHHIDLPFLKLALATSEKMNQHITDLIGEVNSLGVVGLSYRPDVSDTRNSPSLNVISKVRAQNIYGYDELVSSLEDYPHVSLVASMETFIDRIDVLVIFHSLTDAMKSSLLANKRKMRIVDTSNFISDQLAQKLYLNGTRLVGVGKGHWRALGYDQ